MFGLSKSTAGAKAKLIMDSLKIRESDWRWCSPSRLADNPLAWLIELYGFIVDARHVSRDIQEEAPRRGLIPYLP